MLRKLVYSKWSYSKTYIKFNWRNNKDKEGIQGMKGVRMEDKDMEAGVYWGDLGKVRQIQ